MGELIPTVVSILGLLVGGGGSDNPAQGTSNASQAALQSILPDIQTLIKQQTNRAQMTDPLFQSVITGTQGLLPAWMRSLNPGVGGSIAGHPPGGPGAGIDNTPRTPPAIPTPNTRYPS